MFYIEDENKIVLFDEDKEKLQNTLAFMPQYQGLKIIETERPIVNFRFADTEEFQEEQAKRERERLNMLSLTAADVERAIYKAKGMDFEDIVELVRDSQARESETRESQSVNRESQDIDIDQGSTSSTNDNNDTTAHESRITTHEIDLKALKIELKANNFYRGNPYIEQVGALLGFTPEMLDEFFETGDYTKLLPEEEIVDDTESATTGEETLKQVQGDTAEEEVNENTTNTESDIQIQQPVEDSIPEEEITN